MLMRDTASLLLADLASALSLLTRLPVWSHAAPAPRAAWAWPLAGLIVASLAAAATSAALALNLPAGPAAAIALITAALLTGGLHEDGLADTADGLMGGHTKERRLEIMKDSRIGSYGTLALLLVTLTRWSALTALVSAGQHWPALLVAGALSRAPMAVLISALPNARGSGLSHLTGRPPRRAALAAVTLAAAIALLATGSATLPMIFAAAATTALLARAAQKRIGGQTGDILGASQQLAEAAILCMAAASLA